MALQVLPFLLLSLGIVRGSPLSRDTGKVNLAISTKINTAGVANVVEMDRARIQSMKQASHLGRRNASSRPVNATNTIFFYTVEVGVGSPPTSHTLLVDTGSSNTWIGASQSYVVTNSSVNTGNTVSVSYGSGAFYGEEWLDTVTLSPDLVIKNQSIGVASSSAGTNGYFDGILGLGPIDLTQNTISNTYEVATVTDNLRAQGKISQDAMGIFFSPLAKPNNDGELTFGGYDHKLTKSSVKYVPITKTQPSSTYWGIDQSISYGKTTILSSTAGIVDTGSTLILIATDALEKYQSLTGATRDPATGLLAITPAQYAKLQILSFKIGGTTYHLTPNGQIWPRSLNSAIGGNSTALYLIIADIGSPSGSGFDFVNGYGFLQRFYSVFDTTNKRVGFAQTMYTNANSN